MLLATDLMELRDIEISTGASSVGRNSEWYGGSRIFIETKGDTYQHDVSGVERGAVRGWTETSCIRYIYQEPLSADCDAFGLTVIRWG
jgi:hypothetical protein